MISISRFKKKKIHETNIFFTLNIIFSEMPPIDPRLVKAKRFPVHAAVTICHLPEVKRLLTEDAPFHIVRKMPDLELGVLHSACASRPGSLKIFIEIVTYLVEVCTFYVIFPNSLEKY